MNSTGRTISRSSRLALFAVIGLAATQGAQALSLERKVVLFADEYSQPLSTVLGYDGDIFVTLFRSKPTFVKLNKDGRVMWMFEESRLKDVQEDFESSVPLQDGSVVVCESRRSLPGLPLKEYPGALIKVSADGKEIARYDQIGLPENQWSVGSVNACFKWGTDILFVADPLGKNLPPRSIVNGEELAPNLAIRLHSDLSVVWSRTAPIYQPGQILGPRPRARELNDGNLMLSGIDRSVILDPAGSVLQTDTFNYCLLLGAQDNPPQSQIVCRAATYGSPWQLTAIDNHMRKTATLSLGSPATEYSFLAAASLWGGLVALGGGDRHQQADLVLFDSTGKHVATHHFPDSLMLIRSQDQVREILPLPSNRLLVVTQSNGRDVGTSILTWFKF